MIGRLGLVMLVVGELERSVAFYRDVLGLLVTFRSESWTELSAGNVDLGLHAAGNDVAVNPATSCSFAFYVDDAVETVELLRAAGTTIVQEPHEEEFGGKFAVVADPDGYRLQLIQL